VGFTRPPEFEINGRNQGDPSLEIFVGRTPMKDRIVLATLMLALLLFAPNLHAACTKATVLGNWGFTGTGFIILPTTTVPVGAVGVVHFDLAGTISGDQDRSVGGGEAHETIAGTYTISGDCALTITANVYDDSGNLQRTTILKGVVVSAGKQTRMIYQTITLPNGTPLPAVLTLDADKI
jgi:hypothetical protein